MAIDPNTGIDPQNPFDLPVGGTTAVKAPSPLKGAPGTAPPPAGFDQQFTSAGPLPVGTMPMAPQAPGPDFTFPDSLPTGGVPTPPTIPPTPKDDTASSNNTGTDQTSDDPVAAVFPGGLNQQSFQQSVQSFGLPSAKSLNAWWAAHEAELTAAGWTYVPHHNDPSIVGPDGQEWDMIFGAGGSGARWDMHKKGVGGDDLQSSIADAFGGAGNFQAPQAQMPQLQPGQQAFQDQLRQQIMQLLSEAGQSPSIDDPFLRNQQQGFDRSLDRQLEKFQIEQAERLNAQGLGSSGAADVGLEGFQQQQGEASANNAATLVGNELTRRRQELVQGLALAGQIGDADLTRALELELSNIDSELQTNRLNLQSNLGFAGLDLQEYIQNLLSRDRNEALQAANPPGGG